jgi:hypothetical protein
MRPAQGNGTPQKALTGDYGAVAGNDERERDRSCKEILSSAIKRRQMDEDYETWRHFTGRQVLTRYEQYGRVHLSTHSFKQLMNFFRHLHEDTTLGESVWTERVEKVPFLWPSLHTVLVLTFYIYFNRGISHKARAQTYTKTGGTRSLVFSTAARQTYIYIYIYIYI